MAVGEIGPIKLRVEKSRYAAQDVLVVEVNGHELIHQFLNNQDAKRLRDYFEHHTTPMCWKCGGLGWVPWKRHDMAGPAWKRCQSCQATGLNLRELHKHIGIKELPRPKEPPRGYERCEECSAFTIGRDEYNRPICARCQQEGAQS